MTAYSLWHEPWIPVIRITGEPAAVSIRDAIAEAGSLQGVYDASPLVTVSIHRLLQAVLYRIFRPHNTKDWVALWRAKRFDPDRLNSYGVVWADRFNLFDPTRPFYQVPYIADEKVHPITAMILEAASGNNPTLFDHGTAEGMDALPPGRAACHLVAHQLFAVGGGISKPFNRMDGPLTKGLVVEAKGNSLFETLLLNLMPLDHWTSLVPDLGDDVPFWEIEDPPEPAREGTVPLGPMHYLTWQSRQLHLCVDGTSGAVAGCQIRQRYCLPKDGSQVDPGKAYRRNEEEGWLPFKVDKQRAAWQFTHVLLQSATPDQTSPRLTGWLAEAQAQREAVGLDVPKVIRLTVTGLTTDPKKAAKVELWRREQLPVPAVLLEHPGLVGDLEELLTQARRAESLLQRAAVALVWALGEHDQLDKAVTYLIMGKADGKIPPGITSLAQSLGVVIRYWPALETPFREMMEALSEPDFHTVRDHWHTAIRRVAREAFQAVRDSLLQSQAPFEVLSRIDHAFQVRLVRIFAETTPEVTPNDVDSYE